jgi:hypothetical protein
MTLSATASTKPASVPNGRRPTLSDSIDRLDRILDGLSEAIPATVRDALREEVAAAVAEGVRAALVEVLSGEAVQNLLLGVLPTASAPAPTPAPKPSLGSRLLTRARSVLTTVRAWVGGLAQRVAAGVATVGRHVGDGLATAFRWVGGGWRWLRLLPILTTLGGATAACALAASGWGRSLWGGVTAVWARCTAVARRLFPPWSCSFGPLTN